MRPALLVLAILLTLPLARAGLVGDTMEPVGSELGQTGAIVHQLVPDEVDVLHMVCIYTDGHWSPGSCYNEVCGGDTMRANTEGDTLAPACDLAKQVIGVLA